ncbi:hypothetical protein J6590_097119 [Homalodisca vitripennis]|nr:hypothetical protein J6590_097119 [Homalodisca vitripennis]
MAHRHIIYKVLGSTCRYVFQAGGWVEVDQLVGLLVKCIGSCGVSCHFSCVPKKTRGSKKGWLCISCKPEKDKSSSISKLKKNMQEGSELRESVSFLSAAVDKNDELMNAVMTELKRTQEENIQFKNENVELRDTVSHLGVRVRNLEQYSRRQNIEIAGVPETQGENVTAVLKDVERALGVEMKQAGVVAAHRIPSCNKTTENK